eukprot:1088970-Pyramimonas_sp.AAC.1
MAKSRPITVRGQQRTLFDDAIGVCLSGLHLSFDLVYELLVDHPACPNARVRADQKNQAVVELLVGRA